MRPLKKLTILAFAAFAATAASNAAQAQVALTNGATISATVNGTVTRTDPMNSLDLSLYGTPANPSLKDNFVSSAQMIQTFNGTSVSLSFTGTSGVYNNSSWLPGGQNYLIAASGSVNLDFSSTQNYFTTR